MAFVKNDNKYKVIEAMYWKGYSSKEIANQLGMDGIEVLDYMQLLHHKEMKQKARERAQR